MDVGINALVTCSDGTVFPNPKPYRKAKKRLSRLQRRLSKKQINSNNGKKARARLARAYKKERKRLLSPEVRFKMLGIGALGRNPERLERQSPLRWRENLKS
ncbi:transposase [Thermosynechococcus sp.]|uniref:transposase n=1 Tax=Thermosynechococcus sp. TaxID=2814275 RepID=UPI0039199890